MTGPQFPGAGVAGLGQSLAAGLPAVSCGDPTSFSFTKGPVPGAHSRLTCFYDSDSQTAASVEWIVESGNDSDLVHVRLTLNPDFVDNTYGKNCIGWPAHGMPAPPPGMAKMPAPPPAMPMMMKDPMGAKAPHTFMDLVGSDHAEFKLSDAAGKLVLHFKEDYISASSNAPSGYETLGVSGGDGRMIEGDESALVAFSTSLDRNLNACGLSSFTTDSPATDDNYTPVPGAEAWDYRVVYDVWVKQSAFGSAGFGDAVVDFVHASPSKADSPTSTVSKRACPPTWKKYCDDPAGCKDDPCVVTPDNTCGGMPGTPPPPPAEDAGTPSETPI